MDHRTLKVCAACFGAGAVGLVVLLIAVPTLSAFGIAIGTAASVLVGYVGYEIGPVFRAFVAAARAVFPALLRFLARPSPFWFVTAPACWVGTLIFIQACVFEGTDTPGLKWGAAPILSLLLGFMLAMLVDGLQQVVLLVRSESGKRSKAALGVGEMNLALIPLIVVKRILWAACIGIPRVLWMTFRAIHSDERVVCAVDGPLGMLVAYAALRVFVGAPISYTPTATLAAVLFAGVASALFGLVNYELFSKRVLKAVPAKTS